MKIIFQNNNNAAITYTYNLNIYSMNTMILQVTCIFAISGEYFWNDKHV